MKKHAPTPPILAAMVSLTACVPMEPVVDNPDADDCRIESTIGSHVKEVDCDHNPDEPQGNVARTDRDIGGVFGDVVRDGNDELPNFPEGSCGGSAISD